MTKAAWHVAADATADQDQPEDWHGQPGRQLAGRRNDQAVARPTLAARQNTFLHIDLLDYSFTRVG